MFTFLIALYVAGGFVAVLLIRDTLQLHKERPRYQVKDFIVLWMTWPLFAGLILFVKIVLRWHRE